MDVGIIKEKLRNLDVEEAKLNRQRRTISDQLEEAHAALQTAKKVQSEFDAFVERRRTAKTKNLFENCLKSFQSFLNKENRMLAGNDYLVARDKVEEMIRLSRQDVERLDEDLTYCKQELHSLAAEREKLMAEYKMMMTAEEGGTAL